jgi:hypothetical protein
MDCSSRVDDREVLGVQDTAHAQARANGRVQRSLLSESRKTPFWYFLTASMNLSSSETHEGLTS